MSKKAPKLHQWQIEAMERQQAIDEFVAMLRDGNDEYLVGIAREALALYHDAMMRGDRDGRRDPEMLIEACVDTLYRITEFAGREKHEHGERSWPPSRSRFDCWSSASAWLGEQLAAKPGTIPMHGQPGRFVLVVHGCRTDVHYPGLFNVRGLCGEVIDLDRPFFSETGYRSFIHGGARECYFTDEAGIAVDEMCCIIMERDLLTDHNGKRNAECKLHAPPFGLKIWKGNQQEPITNEKWIDQRRTDPAWQRGGFLAELPGLRVTIHEERSGQLAMLF